MASQRLSTFIDTPATTDTQQHSRVCLQQLVACRYRTQKQQLGGFSSLKESAQRCRPSQLQTIVHARAENTHTHTQKEDIGRFYDVKKEDESRPFPATVLLPTGRVCCVHAIDPFTYRFSGRERGKWMREEAVILLVRNQTAKYFFTAGRLLTKCSND